MLLEELHGQTRRAQNSISFAIHSKDTTREIQLTESFASYSFSLPSAVASKGIHDSLLNNTILLSFILTVPFFFAESKYSNRLRGRLELCGRDRD